MGFKEGNKIFFCAQLGCLGAKKLVATMGGGAKVIFKFPIFSLGGQT